MSLALKNKTGHIDNLKHRAQILQQIRAFFAARDVLEVETPLLCSTTATDPHIASITVGTQFLQTSPEFAMKKLLGAGSGAIFQICKAFREEPTARLHHPEFTMLEWYRPGFDHHRLMDEMDALLQTILATSAARRVSYQDCFVDFLSIDPLTATLPQLADLAAKHQLVDIHIDDRDTWLDLLFSHLIQPKLGFTQPLFLYDYPASQSALAKINPANPLVAERFEVFYQGIELANGYHELSDPDEQLRRFMHDNQRRTELGLPERPIDAELVAVLRHGFPECAGVALGVDRLVMLAVNANTIHDVMIS